MKKCLFILLMATTIASANSDFFIQNGDTVLIWGDSITDDGIYPLMIENYVLTRFPDWKVRFFNLGWGGDQAQFYKRLERDIQLCKPTKVTIMLGMNDARYMPFDAHHLKLYIQSIKHEIEIIKAYSNAEILIISPTPYDLKARRNLPWGSHKGHDGSFYALVLERFSHELQNFAQAEGHRFIDLNYEMARVLIEMDQYDRNFMLTAEGVHPNIDGEFMMGLCILRGMGAPDLVSGTVINSKTGKIEETQNCTVDQIVSTADKLTFRKKDAALPLPIHPATRLLIREILDYPNSLNQELLRVTKLAIGWYQLSIDRRVVDIFSDEQLYEGVNLSLYDYTPQMIQAYQVFEATEKRNQAFYSKWRYKLLQGVRSPSDFTSFKENIDVKQEDHLEEQAFKEQHRLNKPTTHQYELKKVVDPVLENVEPQLSNKFLTDRARVFINVDSKTIRKFTSPLCIRGNFAYAPQYYWGLLETKGYYADIPVQLYDDGTHGDRQAADGVYSIEMYFRKNCGEMNFFIQDGNWLQNYWKNWIKGAFRNPYIDEITVTWGEALNCLNEKKNLIRVPLDKNQNLVWDKKLFKQALEKNRLSFNRGHEYISLFDGQSLKGWRHSGLGNFVVEDGLLVSQGGMGLLWYEERKFEDFILKLEWKVSSEKDNSGIFIRFPEKSDDPSYAVNNGYEIQIYDHRKSPMQQTGAIYSFAPIGKLASRPIGEWNEYMIKAVGHHYTVMLNGQVVCEYEGNRNLEGYIGLQNHDKKSKVSFQNIQVKILN